MRMKENRFGVAFNILDQPFNNSKNLEKKNEKAQVLEQRGRTTQVELNFF